MTYSQDKSNYFIPYSCLHAEKPPLIFRYQKIQTVNIKPDVCVSISTYSDVKDLFIEKIVSAAIDTNKKEKY